VYERKGFYAAIEKKKVRAAKFLYTCLISSLPRSAYPSYEYSIVKHYSAWVSYRYNQITFSLALYIFKLM